MNQKRFYPQRIGAVTLSNGYQWLTRLSAKWFRQGPDGWATLPMLLVLMAIAAPAAIAQEAAEPTSLADGIFQPVVDFLAVLLFFKIGGENGFPFIVLWLFVAAIFFTFRMGFINLRGLKHAIAVVQGKFDDPHDEGEVSHFQALATAVSGTVGLGNIAGVAIAIQLGGPGAMFWLTIAGLCGMVSKFVECTLAVKYRRQLPDGTILGGPMYYLNQGLAARGMRPLGQALAVLFSILCLGGSLGGANMFQSNQAYAAISGLIPGLPAWLFGLVLAALSAFVIIGGIKRIGSVAEKARACDGSALYSGLFGGDCCQYWSGSGCDWHDYWRGFLCLKPPWVALWA